MRSQAPGTGITVAKRFHPGSDSTFNAIVGRRIAVTMSASASARFETPTALILAQ